MTGIFVPWNPRNPNSPGWIEDGSGCHIWVGAKSNYGYGQVNHNGKTTHVHRLRYEREVGPIPPGTQLDHFVCDNGPGGCCNPHHCRPVTRRENMLRSDSIAAINRAKTHCPKGHPLSGDNLERYQAQSGGRKCRQCVTERTRAYLAANREAVNARKRAAYHAKKSA